MTDHERQAQALEHELEDMAGQSERLEGEIEEARKDWERKKEDPNVPGAAGEEAKVEERRDAPEADYPTKGPPR